MQKYYYILSLFVQYQHWAKRYKKKITRVHTYAGALILKGASVSRFYLLGFFMDLGQIVSYCGYHQQK